MLNRSWPNDRLLLLYALATCSSLLSLLGPALALWLRSDFLFTALALLQMASLGAYQLIFFRLYRELGAQAAPPSYVLSELEKADTTGSPPELLGESPEEASPMEERIKIVFSHEDPHFHQRVVDELRAGLESEIGTQVDIIQKFTSEETLRFVMDQVVDLVILSPQYPSTRLSCAELVSEIKALDRAIPIVLLTMGTLPAEEGDGVDWVCTLPMGVETMTRLSRFLRTETNTVTRIDRIRQSRKY